MTACVFCEIIARRSPANWVANVANSIAIVPLNPVTPGHVIFMPKVHVQDAFENPVVTGQVMTDVARHCNLESANIITSIGRPATQTVFHLHIHVVPRDYNDGLLLPWSDIRETRLQHSESLIETRASDIKPGDRLLLDGAWVGVVSVQVRHPDDRVDIEFTQDNESEWARPRGFEVAVVKRGPA